MIHKTNLTIDDYRRHAGIGSRTPACAATSASLKPLAAGRFGAILDTLAPVAPQRPATPASGATIADYLQMRSAFSAATVNSRSATFSQARRTALPEAGAGTLPSSLGQPAAPGKAVDRVPAAPPSDEVTAPTEGQGLIQRCIQQAAKRYNLSEALIRSVIRAESNFRSDAVSPAGAQGLMQLMPATARELGVKDPFDPQQNIDGGARYLRQMLDRFGGDLKLALSAYNAGPGTVERFSGEVPFRETRHYLQRVLSGLSAADGHPAPFAG